jgi:hypothetical protein
LPASQYTLYARVLQQPPHVAAPSVQPLQLREQVGLQQKHAAAHMHRK